MANVKKSCEIKMASQEMAVLMTKILITIQVNLCCLILGISLPSTYTITAISWPLPFFFFTQTTLKMTAPFL